MRLSNFLVCAVLLFNTTWPLAQVQCSKEYMASVKAYIDDLQEYRESMLQIAKQLDDSYESRKMQAMMAAISRGPLVRSNFDEQETQRKQREAKEKLETSQKIAEARMKLAQCTQ